MSSSNKYFFDLSQYYFRPIEHPSRYLAYLLGLKIDEESYRYIINLAIKDFLCSRHKLICICNAASLLCDRSEIVFEMRTIL